MSAKPHTYIVRVWMEPNPSGSDVWRASVLDVISQERRYFSSPQELARYLEETEGLWVSEEAEG